jgi:hypothetical protein
MTDPAETRPAIKVSQGGYERTNTAA